MPILDYALPCQLSSIDQRTNAVSLFNIIDTLSVIRRPGQSQEAALASLTIEIVTSWRRLPNEAADNRYTQVLSLLRPDSEEPEELSTIDFDIPHYRYRLHTQVLPIALDQEGTYSLRVELLSDGEVLTDSVPYKYPIQVEITELPILVNLTTDELDALRRPVSGQGGFQSLLRRMQNQIAGNTLVLNESDGERLIRYAERYGSGGFQGRLERVVQQVQDQLGQA
jgi:hypothetical protein